MDEAKPFKIPKREVWEAFKRVKANQGAAIDVAELDLSGQSPVWTIPGGRAKNRQSHRVPLSALAVRIIDDARRLAAGSQFLFPDPTGEAPISAQVPTKAIARARAAIGIQDFRLHDLRRTAATGLAELGALPNTISLVLNHVSVHKGTITGRVYVQYSFDKEKREALEVWGRRLEDILGIRPAPNEPAETVEA